MATTKKTIDKDLCRELELYIENTSTVYFNYTIPVCEQIAKKKAKGQYKKDLAVKAFVNVVKAAIPMYRKEIGPLPAVSQEEKEYTAAVLLENNCEMIAEFTKKAKAKAKSQKKTSKK